MIKKILHRQIIRDKLFYSGDESCVKPRKKENSAFMMMTMIVKKGKRVEFVFTKKAHQKKEKSMPSSAAAFSASVCHILFTT